jgi:6,7-dimethyl-8-ribityllumazine synthase
VDAIVALGCVVRGETPHFEHVTRCACDGLERVALDSGVPVGLGVITADTQAQAEARSGAAGGKGGNKGAEAADAALRMAATRRALRGEKP